MTTPLAPYAPSTSTPSSSTGGVTLEAVIAQLQRMDARLDTLSDELCQVNARVNHITRWQARLGGFMVFSSPSPDASKDEDDKGDSDDIDDDKDGDANSSSDDKMNA